MKKTHWLSLSVMLAALVSLLAGASPVDAGNPVGSSFTISADDANEVSPSIVYNPVTQQYLVAWYNDLPGNDDIHVELVSKIGQVLKHLCVSCGPGAERRYPDVAYNSQLNEYLVVWVEESGGFSLIKAQRLTAEAQPVGGIFAIFAGAMGIQTSAYPAVAYASTSDKYLVVWELENNFPPAPIVTSIIGQVVNSDGTLGSGVNISVDPVGFPRHKPDIAYNRHGNGYLVVWEEYSASWLSHSVISGQILHGSGALIGSAITIAFEFGSDTTVPAVAAIPTTPTNNYKFLVVWKRDVWGGDTDIRGTTLAEDGSLYSPFGISEVSGVSESAPAIAGSESNLQYMVTWRHPLGTMSKPIRARAISYDGSPIGQESEFAGRDADYSAVAAGPLGDFMTAWQDQPLSATSKNLYGQIWGNRLYLPLIIR